MDREELDQGEYEMSNEEHLIENLIAYVQDIGWANVPSNPNSLGTFLDY